MKRERKNYLLEYGYSQSHKINLSFCYEFFGTEEDAIVMAETITESRFDYCYIYELNEDYPQGRKEINYIYHQH